MPATPDRAVFIDTTELMAKGKSPVFAAALRRLAQQGSVVTSTLVLDELTANYKKHRREATKDYGYYFPSDRLPDAPSLRQEYTQHLKSVGVVVLPVTVAVDEVTAADLEGGHPFKKEGAGYRDFINWVTFVDHVKASGAPAGSFLTNNHKDFGSGTAEGGGLPDSLLAVARGRGCTAVLEALRADDFIKQRVPKSTAAGPTVDVQQALRGWLSIAEDAEILGAMQLPGPGPGVELKVLAVRDKEAELLRGPEGGAVQMVFRATFDCIVIVDSQVVAWSSWRHAPLQQNQPWVTAHQTVRLEWTVEAPFDDKRGITGIPRQIAPLRRLDPTSGKPLG